jgi:hypothetical protein
MFTAHFQKNGVVTFANGAVCFSNNPDIPASLDPSMNTKLIPSILLCSLLSVSTGFSKDKTDHHAKQKAHREAVFKAIDTNHDGAISEEEFVAKKGRKHKKHDKKNGALKNTKAGKQKHKHQGKKGKKARKAAKAKKD